MLDKRNSRLIYIFVIVSLTVSSCSGANIDEMEHKSATNIISITEVVQSIQEHTETLEPTQVFQTPTPDLRTPPDQWQDWPIIPEVTNKAIDIYQHGKLKGINSHAFSKIGDCHNIKEAFLGIYDKEGRYFLRPDELEWQLTIDNFTGYFDRDGEAIEQGLNVATALSPLHANADNCLASEGPLQCELRTIKPSFAFVSFERWWSNETPPEVYEKYLRIVIETIISNGTVPILVTKADNKEGNHRLNQIIVNLAFEYDIPLYNWWKAAQFLPHRGMDPERDDGFHISFESWDTRSYYALETLDHLWKSMEN